MGAYRHNADRHHKCDIVQTTTLLKIEAPTLILTGRQDPARSVDHAIMLNRMIDGSKMVILEEAPLIYPILSSQKHLITLF